MYPIECPGRFFVPVKRGLFEIVGMEATVDDISSMSRVVIIDAESFDLKPETYDARKGIIDVKDLPMGLAFLNNILENHLRQGMDA